jgi:hypothetical protein
MLRGRKIVLVFIHNRVFCTDAIFIRTENAVGARSAQGRSPHATLFDMPYIVSRSENATPA